MRSKNKLLTMLLLSSATLTAISFINKIIKISATSQNILSSSTSHCYKWRLGNLHYTKIGTGKPILLIHDLTVYSSSIEWKNLIEKLSKTYTVYAIDLLGCGLSDKPCLTYTNYLYVQMISDFIRSEIKKRTDVVTSGASSSIAIMACNNSPELFDRLLFINPEKLDEKSIIPGKYARIYMQILSLPILGGLLYNIAAKKEHIVSILRSQCYFNPFAVETEYIDANYESAHLGESPSSLYASIRCNYTKINIVNSIRKIDHSIFILAGDNEDSIDLTLQNYCSFNPAIEYSKISDSKHLPHMEKPDETFDMIEMYFHN